MKKLLCVIVLFCMLFVAACSEEPLPPVLTYDQSKTEGPASTEPSTTELTQEVSETTQAPSDSPAVVMPKYEITYYDVMSTRDVNGNPWLNVIVQVINMSDEPISITQGTVLLDYEGEEQVVLENVNCYPQLLQPGQSGVFFEQSHTYVPEDIEPHLEIEANVERANDCLQHMDETSQISDGAYGVEVNGTFPAQMLDEGQLCVAAILFNTEQKPFWVMSDLIESDINEFTLSSDKLPEGLRKEDISSHVVYVYPYGG